MKAKIKNLLYIFFRRSDSFRDLIELKQLCLLKNTTNNFVY